MILVDSSVWVAHFRCPNVQLQELLQARGVLTHPFVIGEIACGSMRNRAQILARLSRVKVAEVAEHHEVLRMLEDHRLWGTGIGWVDAHLLASALLTGCGLWTHDHALRAAAGRLKLERGPWIH